MVLSQKRFDMAMVSVFALHLVQLVPHTEGGNMISLRTGCAVVLLLSASSMCSGGDTNSWGRILYTHYTESDVCNAPMSTFVLGTLGANETVKADFKRGTWYAVFRPSEAVRSITNAVGYMQADELFTNALPVGPIEGGVGSAPPIASSIENMPTLAQIREGTTKDYAIAIKGMTEDEKTAERLLKAQDKRLQLHGISPIEWLEVEEIYGINSKLTDLQQSELWRRYEGRRVEWTGEVYQVQDKDLYVRMNPLTEHYDIHISLVGMKDVLDRINKLKKGDTITFRGTFLKSATFAPVPLGYGEVVKLPPVQERHP